MNISEAFNGIIKNAESANKKDDDYIVDGIAYCGKCHTPKQVKVNFAGIEKTVYCICNCKKEELQRREQEEKQREKMKLIKRLRSAGFPQNELTGWNFANATDANDKIILAAKRYVENFDTMRENGKGLLLYGPVGTGKTFAAACIVNALIDKGVPCLMTNFARISNTVQGMFEGKQKYYDSFNKYPLLVIDDLSAERKTEYMQEIVFNVIDARYRAKLPLIITTNLTSYELKHPADITYQRTFSRLLEMCHPVEVEGKDKRHAKVKDDFEKMNDLLGL